MRLLREDWKRILLDFLKKSGYDCTSVREKGRKLILPVKDANIEVVLAKANDVITYVEHGVCDMGVVGKDTIMEMSGKFFRACRPRFLDDVNLLLQLKGEQIFMRATE